MLSWAKDVTVIHSGATKTKVSVFGSLTSKLPKHHSHSAHRKEKRRASFFTGAEFFTMAQKYSILAFLVYILRRVLDIGSNLFFHFLYRGHKEELPPIRNLYLLESASSLAHKIRTKKVKSEVIVESFISRIKETNGILNSMVDNRFEAALSEAREIDAYIQTGRYDENTLATEKPFLGVPFTIKDCFAVKGLHHTAGLYSRRNQVAKEDADVVALMRKAGAIPLAVTNVSELCMWWESHNLVYGRTRNPYDTTRIVGGSSGGEASINGSAGSAFGIGSDIGGSVRLPAFFCGIFGHKPSTGTVTHKGQIPEVMGEMNDFLVTGPICRFACDLLPMYRVMADSNINKLKLDAKVDITKLKYFYMEDDGGFPFITPVHFTLKASMKRVVNHLEKAYHIKSQKLQLKKMKRSLEMWAYKMAGVGAEFCEELAERKGKVNVYWEFLKWPLGLSSHTLPALGLGLLEKIPLSLMDDHAQLINMCDDLRMELYDLLGDNGVLFYPSHPTTAPYHYQPLLCPANFAYTAIFNLLGMPVTQCPLGLNDDGLPLGIQVVASTYNDHITLAIAAELERAFGGWVPPSTVL